MKHEQGGPVNHHLSLQDVRILNLSRFLPLPWFLRIDHRKYSSEHQAQSLSFKFNFAYYFTQKYQEIRYRVVLFKKIFLITGVHPKTNGKEYIIDVQAVDIFFRSLCEPVCEM